MLWLVPLIAISGLTQAPELSSPADIVYPADAADAGVQGTVVLQVDLGPDGKVMSASVATSSGSDALDQAALDGVKRFVFRPAEIDGVPAAVRLEYAYHFELKPEVQPADAGPLDAGPPQVNLSGTLNAMGTREPIAFALVSAGEAEAQSDEAGRFALSVPEGPLRVRVSAAGFSRFESDETVVEGERTEVTYYLHPDGAAPETVVRAERQREVAQVKLTRAEARYVPGVGNDGLKVLQNLPGISRSPFSTGFLIVRGSKAWDSRVYVDDIQIPQLFHFGGLNATVNSELVETIAFQPGNFSASHGRSIGGLVLLDLKTPSRSGTHGYFDLSFFDVSVMVESEVSEKWSVAASARRGLVDATLPFALNTFAPSLASQVGIAVAPVYWDYSVRAERKGEGTNRVFISLYGASDAWAFVRPIPFLDPDSEGNQGTFGRSQLFNRLTVGVDHQLAPKVKLYSRNSVGFDRTVLSGATTDITYQNDSFPIQLRERVTVELLGGKLLLNAGLDLLMEPLRTDAQAPPPFKANQVPDPYVERRLLADHSSTFHFQPGLFVEAAWKPTASLELAGSLRGDYESTMNRAWADPRLALFFSPLERLTVKAAAGLFHQPPDYRAGLLSPVFGNPDLLPEAGAHFMAGAEVRLTDALGLDVQGYYKHFFHQARQTLASGIGSDVNIPGAEAEYTSLGYGRAYGVELLLRHKFSHNFFGWVAYSFSRFERDYYGGVVYAPGPLDQPHNLIAVASYRLPFDFVVGARVRWASGLLVTPIVAALYDTNGNYYYPLPGLPWSRRLPDYFALDLRVDKRFVFQSFVLALYLDVQNVTNHQNVEGVFYNFDYSQKQYVYGQPVLPSLGLRAEF
ncbi:MAG: TonB family protein [Archangiaceae bacterium]|nr:TonB family protein [Archangiaceae bacterium]